MPRYELRIGAASKFWEVTVEGRAVSTHWGRVGSRPQRATHHYPSEVEALHECEKLVRARIKQGYLLVAPLATPVVASVEPRHAELEAAIHARLDATEPYLVYGDWLQSRGDPLGALVAAQAGRDNPTLSRQSAVAFWGADLAAHLIDHGSIAVRWHCGFVRSLYVGNKPGAHVRDPGQLLDRALALPVCRFVREVSVGLSDLETGEAHAGSSVEVLARHQPAALTSLTMLDFAYPADAELSWAALGDVSPLWRCLPQLQHLRLCTGSELVVGELSLPRLQSLVVETSGLRRENLAAIATASLPSLERLELWLGSPESGATCSLDQLVALLARQAWPRLRHLAIKNTALTDELIEPLAASPLLRQLSVLDLSLGTLTDAGASALARHRDAFAHLERLNVSLNGVAQRQELVADIARHVELGLQRDFGEPPRPVVAVAE